MKNCQKYQRRMLNIEREYVTEIISRIPDVIGFDWCFDTDCESVEVTNIG